MSEGSFWPKSWTEARPQIVWAVLIFAFGFEGVGYVIPCVVHFLQGKPWVDEALQAALGFAGMFGLTAMLIHGGRIREKFSDIRWLIAACMFATMVFALSPYVEQRQWPFAHLILPSSTQATSAQPDARDVTIATLRSQITTLQSQLEAARQQPTPQAGQAKQLAELQSQNEALADQLKVAKERVAELTYTNKELAKSEQDNQVEAAEDVAAAQAKAADAQQRLATERMSHMEPSCVDRLLGAFDRDGAMTSLQKTMIILTPGEHTGRLQGNLRTVLMDISRARRPAGSAAGGAFVVAPPIDYVKYPDAPRLTSHRDAGVTIHGKGPAVEFLMRALSSLFMMHQMADLPSSLLLDYYHDLSPEFASYDTIVWIDMGAAAGWSFESSSACPWMPPP